MLGHCAEVNSQCLGLVFSGHCEFTYTQCPGTQTEARNSNTNRDESHTRQVQTGGTPARSRWGVQWRIQDIQEEGTPTPKVGAQPIIWSKLSRKLHENERIGTPRAACIPGAPLDLPMGYPARDGVSPWPGPNGGTPARSRRGTQPGPDGVPPWPGPS